MAAQTELQIVITAINNIGQQLSQVARDINAITAAATGQGRATQQAGAEAQRFGKSQQEAGRHTRDLTNVLPLLHSTLTRVGNAVRFVTGGFLAFQSVRIIKDILDTAARAETLG